MLKQIQTKFCQAQVQVANLQKSIVSRVQIEQNREACKRMARRVRKRDTRARERERVEREKEREERERRRRREKKRERKRKKERAMMNFRPVGPGLGLWPVPFNLIKDRDRTSVLHVADLEPCQKLTRWLCSL